MTLIFAKRINVKEIEMRADSSIVQENSIRTMEASKILSMPNGQFPVHVGVAGSLECRRAAEMLLRTLRSESNSGGKGFLQPERILEAFEQLVASLAETEDEETEEKLVCDFLIVINNRIILMTPHGPLSFDEPGFVCIGSGAEYAEGALLVSEELVNWNDFDERENGLNRVCEVVEGLCPTVRGPFKSVVAIAT